MEKIKVGEPQPVDCKTCKGKEGYQYNDCLQVYYSSNHNQEGNLLYANYSDSSKTINRSVTPYCINCGEKLNFKLIRNPSEVIEIEEIKKGNFI